MVVHVITAELSSVSEVSAWKADVEHPGIRVYRLPRRYPDVLHRWPLTSVGQKLAYRFWLKVLPLLSKGNPLDTALFWRAPLLKKASELIERHGIRNVIASGAPFRLLAHALEIKRSHPSIHLVADLRDPWTWWDNYGHSGLSPERFAQEQGFERNVMLGSDKIISPSASVIAHIRSHYPEAASKCVVIPHSIDPDDIGLPKAPRNDGHFRMIYAGTLYGADEADHYFDALISAFRSLQDTDPSTAERTELHLYITANDTSRYSDQVAKAGLAERIRFEAPLPPKDIFGRIAQADAALVFIPSKNKDLVGTKFHELFHLRIPVIHVGEPGEVSRTILAAGAGISLRVNELALELPKIMTKARPLPIDPSFDSSYLLLDRVTDRLTTEVLG